MDRPRSPPARGADRLARFAARLRSTGTVSGTLLALPGLHAGLLLHQPMAALPWVFWGATVAGQAWALAWVIDGFVPDLPGRDTPARRGARRPPPRA